MALAGLHDDGIDEWRDARVRDDKDQEAPGSEVDIKAGRLGSSGRQHLPRILAVDLRVLTSSSPSVSGSLAPPTFTLGGPASSCGTRSSGSSRASSLSSGSRSSWGSGCSCGTSSATSSHSRSSCCSSRSSAGSERASLCPSSCSSGCDGQHQKDERHSASIATASPSELAQAVPSAAPRSLSCSGAQPPLRKKVQFEDAISVAGGCDEEQDEQESDPDCQTHVWVRPCVRRFLLSVQPYFESIVTFATTSCNSSGGISGSDCRSCSAFATAELSQERPCEPTPSWGCPSPASQLAQQQQQLLEASMRVIDADGQFFARRLVLEEPVGADPRTASALPASLLLRSPTAASGPCAPATFSPRSSGPTLSQEAASQLLHQLDRPASDVLIVTCAAQNAFGSGPDPASALSSSFSAPSSPLARGGGGGGGRLGCDGDADLRVKACRGAAGVRGVPTASCGPASNVLTVEPYDKEYGQYDDLLDALATVLVDHVVPAAAAAPARPVGEVLQRLRLAGVVRQPVQASPVMQALRSQRSKLKAQSQAAGTAGRGGGSVMPLSLAAARASSSSEGGGTSSAPSTLMGMIPVNGGGSGSPGGTSSGGGSGGVVSQRLGRRVLPVQMLAPPQALPPIPEQPQLEPKALPTPPGLALASQRSFRLLPRLASEPLVVTPPASARSTSAASSPIRQLEQLLLRMQRLQSRSPPVGAPARSPHSVSAASCSPKPERPSILKTRSMRQPRSRDKGSSFSAFLPLSPGQLLPAAASTPSLTSPLASPLTSPRNCISIGGASPSPASAPQVPAREGALFDLSSSSNVRISSAAGASGAASPQLQLRASTNTGTAAPRYGSPGPAPASGPLEQEDIDPPAQNDTFNPLFVGQPAGGVAVEAPPQGQPPRHHQTPAALAISQPGEADAFNSNNPELRQRPRSFPAAAKPPVSRHMSGTSGGATTAAGGGRQLSVSSAAGGLWPAAAARTNAERTAGGSPLSNAAVTAVATMAAATTRLFQRLLKRARRRQRHQRTDDNSVYDTSTSSRADSARNAASGLPGGAADRMGGASLSSGGGGAAVAVVPIAAPAATPSMPVPCPASSPWSTGLVTTAHPYSDCMAHSAPSSLGGVHMHGPAQRQDQRPLLPTISVALQDSNGQPSPLSAQLHTSRSSADHHPRRSTEGGCMPQARSASASASCSPSSLARRKTLALGACPSSAPERYRYRIPQHDTRLASEALRQAHLHSQAQMHGKDGTCAVPGQQLASARLAAARILHPHMRSLVEEAVERYADPLRGRVREVLRCIAELELTHGSGGGASAVAAAAAAGFAAAGPEAPVLVPRFASCPPSPLPQEVRSVGAGSGLQQGEARLKPQAMADRRRSEGSVGHSGVAVDGPAPAKGMTGTGGRASRARQLEGEFAAVR